MVWKQSFVILSQEGCFRHHTDRNEGVIESSATGEVRGAAAEGLLPAHRNFMPMQDNHVNRKKDEL